MANECVGIEDKSTVVKTTQSRNLLVIEDEKPTLITSKQQGQTTIIQEETDPTVILDPAIKSIINVNIQQEAIHLYSPGEGCAPSSPPVTPPDPGVAGAALFAANVTSSSGIIGDKVWELETIPPESSIISAVTDSDNVTIHVFVEGGVSKYTPVIIVDGITVANLTQPTPNIRTYEGSVDTLVTSSRDIEITSSTGTTDSVFIERAAAGPDIVSIVFGAYPGSQTELKQNDLIPVTITTEPEAVSVTIEAFGASKIEQTLAVVGGIATDNVNISSASGQQSIRVSAVNSLGTQGDDFTSSTLTLNQTYPSINSSIIVYPASQEALKNSETADVTASVTDFTTILYTTSGDLDHQSPTNVYTLTKTVQRINGNYVESGSNYSISANRAANDATTVRNSLVWIANIAPTGAVTIDGNPSSLSSTPAGTSYNVRVTASQVLNLVPTMSADLGTFDGSFVGSGKVYTDSLLIEDSTLRGTGTFSSLSMTGLSDLVGTSISSGSSYEVAGFPLRQLTVPAYSQTVAIGTSVENFNQTRFRYAGTSEWLTRRTNTSNFVKGFTITDSAGNYDPDGDYAFITDLAFANSNSSGTLKVDIEEQT